MRNKILKNQKIRIAMIQNNIKQYEVAKLLGKTETGFCRKLREELPEEEQDEIVAKILEKTEQEARTDTVNRKAVCDYIAEFVNNEFDLMIEGIKHLPSVTQKPIECDDAISREDKKHIDGFKYWCETNEENGTITIPKFVCNEIVKILDNLPSVTQKSGKWIPVSERLPEQDRTGCSNWHSVKVFAQIKSNINDVWETEIVKGYFIELDNEMAFSLKEFPLCIPDEWDFITLDKDNRAYDEEYSERYVELQAWMPLPEPYREKGDHE